MKLFCILSLFMCSLFVKAQGYEISININGVSDTVIYLGTILETKNMLLTQQKLTAKEMQFLKAIKN
ncbi:MAG: hypothetical protein PHW82_14760 [Bacteroidales bacterium]|nr:hypothetical protein [Bacteroidales bacterium]